MMLRFLCGAARAERVPAGAGARPPRRARALGMRRLPPEAVAAAAAEAMRMLRHGVEEAGGIPVAGAGRTSGAGGRGGQGVPPPDEEEVGVAVGKERAGEAVVALGVAQRKARAGDEASSRCLRSVIEVAEAGA